MGTEIQRQAPAQPHLPRAKQHRLGHQTNLQHAWQDGQAMNYPAATKKFAHDICQGWGPSKVATILVYHMWMASALEEESDRRVGGSFSRKCMQQHWAEAWAAELAT